MSDAFFGCRPDQVMEEVSSCLKMLDDVYQTFGLTYKAALSTRPESYLGTLEQWETAESALKAALDATGKDWEVSNSCILIWLRLFVGHWSCLF